MADKNPKSDLTDNPLHKAGPSISNLAGVSEEIRVHNEEAEDLQAQLESHANAMQELHKKLVSTQSASTAFKNLAKNTVKNKKAKNRSSFQRRPHQPISGKVKNLIEKEIFENNKKQVKVAKTFGISDQQVRRIIANRFTKSMWCEIEANDGCHYLDSAVSRGDP